MRIAIVSDIHGNLTALDAVIADLRETAPDLILHGGDLADSGARPAETVDRIRELGWPGVVGNTDEMLFRPESLAEFAKLSPNLAFLFSVVKEMADAAREALGDARLAWLRELPRVQLRNEVALVHASPGDLWRTPLAQHLDNIYAPLGRPVAVYAHIHCPFVRRLDHITLANTGSVGLPYDGDPRAAYLLLDGAEPVIRRVDYDIHRETQALKLSGLPHAEWIASLLPAGRFQMPN